MMTSKYHVAVLAYEQETEDVLTKAFGNVKVRLVRLSCVKVNCVKVSCVRVNSV